MNILNWLEKWYKLNVDSNGGLWAEHHGARIHTLDNPGWAVKIDLVGTLVEREIFENIEIDNGDDDWVHCRVRNEVFEGFGDPFKLEKILNIFKEWVEINTKKIDVNDEEHKV